MEGDEVIVPALTMSSTAISVVQAEDPVFTMWMPKHLQFAQKAF